MSTTGLSLAQAAMRADGAPAEAIEVFTRHYRALEGGASGLISEADIEPLRELVSIDKLDIAAETIAGAMAQTVVIKLNGGLGTSMGLDAAKSLLPVKDGRSFLDIIVAQVLSLRRRYQVELPLVFMNSFRTRADTLAVLQHYPDLKNSDIPSDFLQNREPKLLIDDLAPAHWPADEELAWCPPGHGDIYPALRGSGLLHRLREQGYRYAFCSNSDNLGAVVDPRIAGWLAQSGVPFVMESCVRTPADRKGGHLAIRRSDGRLILRETAQTSAADMDALQDLSRHRYCNTNNIWIDLQALEQTLDASHGVLDLPLIRNEKTVDPSDPSSPKVIQIESAMGAAVQCFDGAQSLLVGRDRFVPVKTTNDLLVLRSDAYQLDDDAILRSTRTQGDPFVDLDPRYYKLLAQFDERFPEGPVSLADCDSLVVRGDVTFAAGVHAHGDVQMQAAEPITIAAGTHLGRR